ncbi:MAG TPA: WecB/TagA/CpsF family glycosyltransferase [Alphaproteobacteria bacterium]|nr:WecB/TagA/CpsF family glycosyltransferase [Alphaproteobacteria bacterium]
MRDITVLGNKVTDLTTAELLAEVDAIIARGASEVILNTNVHGINLAQRLPWLKAYRNSIRVTHADGAGIALGARLLGYRMGPRVCINDFIWDLARYCREHDRSVFLLGAAPDVVTRAAAALKAREPNVRIAGIHNGYFAKQGPENDRVVALINEARPNILLVGFGMPVQEQWVRDNVHRLNANVIMVVGGFFDRLSGEVPWTPRWMTENGLEWVYLSLRRPRRFFDRYLIGNPKFLIQVLLERFGLLNGSSRYDPPPQGSRS